MSFYETARESSDAHNARELKGGGLQLTPIDSSREAIERFQPIAHEAFERQHEGYAVDLENESTMYAGRLYDMLVLRLLADR